MQYIYLHGFASSPNSTKARYLRDRFAEIQIDLKIPDLNFGDFSQLTITRQANQVWREFPLNDEPVTLIGSSLGGLTAAYLGNINLQVQQLVLLAPAFEFLSHWLPLLGEEQVRRWQEDKFIMVYHYGEKRSLPLSINFLIDASQYKVENWRRSIPTLILHGQHDETIPIQASRYFAHNRPWVELIEFDSDHALSNVMADIWLAIQSKFI